MEKFNYNEMLEEMKENLKNMRVIYVVNQGNFVLSQSGETIDVIDSETEKVFMGCLIPYEVDRKHIDLRIRKKIGNMFIEKYTYEEVLKEKIEEERIKQLQAQEEEEKKYILEDLKIKIDNLLSQYYSRHRKKSELNFVHSFNKYEIRLSCSKNHLSSVEFQINREGENFELYDSDSDTGRIILTETELMNYLQEKKIIFQKHYEEVQEEERIKKEKIDKENKVLDFIYDTCDSLKDDEVIILKNKNSYIAFKKTYRYAVGTGKSGKFLNCTKDKMINMILEKNINDYVIGKDSLYSNDELKALQYKKIC